MDRMTTRMNKLLGVCSKHRTKGNGRLTIWVSRREKRVNGSKVCSCRLFDLVATYGSRILIQRTEG